MPSYKSPQSLYQLCLDVIFEKLYELLNSCAQRHVLQQARMYLITNVPSKIRQHILNFAVLKDKNRILFVLDLIRLIADSSTHVMCPTLANGFLLLMHYEKLVNYLYRNNCTGLNMMSVRVILEERDEIMEDKLRSCNQLLNILLRKGLGNNLRSLTLEGVCNNELMACIGKECVHLQQLDITNSWFVTDVGIRSLCLKNPERFEIPQKRRDYDSAFVTRLLSFGSDDLTCCSYTLRNIRIQDTDTSIFSLYLLLLCGKNLTTFGGFIYYRNVGDVVAELGTKFNGTLELKLEQLYDANLPKQKAVVMKPILPHLRCLYTRIRYLWPDFNPFSTLTSLTVDFGYERLENQFCKYLENYGKTLKSITLIDQGHYVNIHKLAEYCPDLEELNAYVRVPDDVTPNPMLKLRFASVTICSSATFLWVLENAHNLENYEAFFYNDRLDGFVESSQDITNLLMKQILSCETPCVRTLKMLHISLLHFCTVSYKTIKRVIMKFERLRHIGDFDYLKLPRKTFKKLLKEIKNRNWDVHLHVGNEVFPPLPINPDCLLVNNPMPPVLSITIDMILQAPLMSEN